MKNAIQTDVIVPTELCNLDNDIERLVGVLTGHEVIPCEGSTGASPEGPYREGDVSYYDCADGLGYVLSYDFEDVGFGMSRIVRYAINRDNRFDGMFDVTRERLTMVLDEFDERYKDWEGMHELLLRIGGQFGIRI